MDVNEIEIAMSGRRDMLETIFVSKKKKEDPKKPKPLTAEALRSKGRK